MADKRILAQNKQNHQQGFNLKIFKIKTQAIPRRPNGYNSALPLQEARV